MDEITVETRAGKVRGKKDNSESDGLEFFSFKGIPYARAPIGELRFRDPQPLEPWTDVREATSHGSKCAQKDMFTNRITGGEDCLYLNIYARSIDPKQRWPVMVWIHGGAFIGGDGDDILYGPDYFMRKNVVLVTINYRVGVLGFLNLDDKVATGNQGLKDQVMALQWVRDNIANFGGDPGNVTIFGQSAGGASIHYLSLSPSAEGLFHKAIAQSGVALSSWAYHDHCNLKDKAYRLCERLGYTERDPKSIVEFLRTIDVHELIEAQEKIATMEEKVQFEFTFGPSIDSKSKAPFMSVHPEEVAAKGVKVPLMIGYTSREGICFSKEYAGHLDRADLDIGQVLNRYAKDAAKKFYNLTPEDLNAIYFNDKVITKKNLENLVDFSGDLYFVEGIQRAIKTQIDQKRAPTYVYLFTYDKEPSFIKMLCNVQMNGASHADELAFLFKANLPDVQINQSKSKSLKDKINEQMIEMWVNFATTGNPTPQASELIPINWQPIDEKSGFRYMNIGETLRMELARDISQQYAARQYPKHV